MNATVTAHKQQRTITEVVIYPEHAQRTESPEFRRSVQRLKDDGHYRCYICGSAEKVQVHHFGAEWALSDDVDFDKLKEFCETHDIYGYGKLLKNKPFTSVDDVRNMMAICEHHHIEKETGIHETTFPVWISQKIAKTGIETI